MATYAANTEVSTERSKAEIERLLARYGADQFISGWQESEAVIGFRANGKMIRFNLPLPRKDEKRFVLSHGGRRTRASDQILKVWDQTCRQSWRALALVIKAKLEAVESEITSFETEFMAHIVMPDGRTVGDHVRPNIEHAYQSGKVPPLLPYGPKSA